MRSFRRPDQLWGRAEEDRTMFKRSLYQTLQDRLQEARRFIQVLAGPRQTGKTTLARQVLESIDLPAHYAAADEPALRDRVWVEQQWELGRLRAESSEGRGALLVLDEVQKIPGWSDVVKRLWDEDTAHGRPLRVLLLGSSPLLVQRGLAESLAGRFEMLYVPHWSFAEMRDAFGVTLDQFIYFGGYPGAAPLIGDRERWSLYIKESLIETTVSRDILLLTRVDKPALLRRLFQLACDYSGQILSYQKMLGQLQDAGNTTTLAHYLNLLGGAGMVTGLQKFTGQKVRQRASSPKLQVLNTAFIAAQSTLDLEETRGDRETWGRLAESAVGAHLVNSSFGTDIEVFYWRERSREVDFVLRRGSIVTAIEVKSGARRQALPGLAAFEEAFRPQRKLLVGGQGIGIEECLLTPARAWVS